VHDLSYNIREQSEFTTARAGTLRLGNKAIETPRRCLHVGTDRLSESLRINNSEARGLNELYRVIDQDTLRELANNVGSQEVFNAHIQNALSRISPGEISLVFLAYDGRTESQPNVVSLPDANETEYLADLSYSFGDAVIPPVLVGQSAGNYLAFLKQYFQIVKGLDHKPIFGLVPYCSWRELRPLLEFYRNEGLHLFTMDLRGRPPTLLSQNVVMTLRTLRQIQSESGQDCYLNALNVGTGRALPQMPVAPAKDILSLVAGFDSFGPSHVALKVRPDLLPFRGTKPAVRLFVRRDYGYYRSDAPELNNPADLQENLLSTSLDDVRHAESFPLARKLQKVYNAERQALEAGSMRSTITSHESIKNFLGSKKQVTDELRKVTRMASELSIPTLD